jgi:hypothetical protein
MTKVELMPERLRDLARLRHAVSNSATIPVEESTEWFAANLLDMHAALIEAQAARIEALERERAAAMKVIAAAREVADVVEGEKHVMAPLDAALAAFDRAAAASPVAPPAALRPMADAPRDESWVVLHFPPNPGPVRWPESGWAVGFWSTGEDPDWYESEISGNSMTKLYGAPDGWLPLPAAASPPAPARATEGQEDRG